MTDLCTSSDVRDIYDRVAPRCDGSRELRLPLAGAEAEAAMLDDLRPILAPSARKEPPVNGKSRMLTEAVLAKCCSVGPAVPPGTAMSTSAAVGIA